MKANPKPVKPASLSALHTRLDTLVSQIVRLRDRYCRTCHIAVEFNADGLPVTLTCSHFIRRGHHSVRWDLRNCNCQCMGCNQYNDRDPKPYRIFMLEKYGKKVVAELEEASFRTKSFSRADLEELGAELLVLRDELRDKES